MSAAVNAIQPRTMRAVVLSHQGGPENLVLSTLPLPLPQQQRSIAALKRRAAALAFAVMPAASPS